MPLNELQGFTDWLARRADSSVCLGRTELTGYKDCGSARIHQTLKLD